MNRRIVLLITLIVIALVVVGWLIMLNKKEEKAIVNPSIPTSEAKKITPSNTLIEYSDPSGFAFSYPDNLSIEKNEIDDNNTYTDLFLSAKGVNGSLNLKISDSKLASIDAWQSENGTTSTKSPKKVKLGTLDALELKLNDRLLLGALDKGVFFSIEIPLVAEDFWMEVYNKILTNFTFSIPSDNTAVQETSSGSISFEGEEAVE